MSIGPVITIDLDKKCAECGKAGAADNLLCLKCTSKAAFQNVPLKSAQAKAVRERSRQLIAHARRETT